MVFTGGKIGRMTETITIRPAIETDATALGKLVVDTWRDLGITQNRTFGSKAVPEGALGWPDIRRLARQGQLH